MSFFRGFLIWGIIGIILAASCFFLWKSYFCRLRGLEKRKITTLAGSILIFLTTMSFLFLPLVLCKSKMFTETKDKFIDGIKKDIVSRTRDAFYLEAEDTISNFVYKYVPEIDFSGMLSYLPDDLDSILVEKLGLVLPEGIDGGLDLVVSEIPMEFFEKYLPEQYFKMISKDHDGVVLGQLPNVLENEFLHAKENVIKYAIKYSKNRTLKDSFENAFKLLRIGDYDFGILTESIVLDECNKIVENYSKEIRKDYIQNSLMKIWVKPIVKNVTMETFTGLEPNIKILKAFNKAKKAFDQLFLTFAILASVVVAAIIIFIIFMLREPEDEINKTYARKHLFEFNQAKLEEINKRK